MGQEGSKSKSKRSTSARQQSAAVPHTLTFADLSQDELFSSVKSFVTDDDNDGNYNNDNIDDDNNDNDDDDDDNDDNDKKSSKTTTLASRSKKRTSQSKKKSGTTAGAAGAGGTIISSTSIDASGNSLLGSGGGGVGELNEGEETFFGTDAYEEEAEHARRQVTYTVTIQEVAIFQFKLVRVVQ